MTNDANDDGKPKTRPQRLAKGKRLDRERQQALRNRKKATKAPTTHTINRAIAHCFMAAYGAEFEQGRNVVTAKVAVGKIFEAAVVYLSAGTHGGNSFEKREIEDAIRSRVKRIHRQFKTR